MKRPAATTKSPKTVDEYVAGAPKDTRAALTTLRKLIKGAAPRATEGISYGIVGYKYNGKPLAGFGYWQDHYALYGSNERFLSAAERKRYATGKGTLRFTPDSPLPARLVTKIMKARLAEIDET